MDYKTEPKQQEPQLICLCAACASAFYNVPTIRIRRADRYQFVKDTCTYCGIRSGYDYIVASRKVPQRHSVKQIRPVELPPADYLSLLDELSSLRRSIDTLAARAAEGGTSTLNPVEYYTLSSLTALTLQKIRLAALPQQCQLPEDMIHE